MLGSSVLWRAFMFWAIWGREIMSSAAGWIIQGLLMATLLGLYWYFRPPQNPVESIMGASFCLVTSWIGKKLIEWMIGR